MSVDWVLVAYLVGIVGCVGVLGRNLRYLYRVFWRGDDRW